MVTDAGSQLHCYYAEKAGKVVQPVFISIDPERDNTKQVKKYVKEFHPRLLGLTGSVDQVSILTVDTECDKRLWLSIAQCKCPHDVSHKVMRVLQVRNAAKAYRVYFTKTDDTEDYLVDHSIIMYLIDPTGNFISFYGKNYTAEQLATAVGSQVDNWKV